jgi:hypothetical protein
MNPTYLPADHPSINTQQAYFLFSVDDGLFIVEAKNQFAVQAIELLVGISEDYTAAPGVRMMAIFRDCGVVGIRQEDIINLEYVDFLVKVADHKLIATIPNLKECIAASLNPAERLEIARITKNIQEKSKTEEEASEDEEEASEDEVMSSSNRNHKASNINTDSLISIFTNLGFSKSAVKKYVTSLGSRVSQEPIEVLLRTGIQYLS